MADFIVTRRVREEKEINSTRELHSYYFLSPDFEPSARGARSRGNGPEWEEMRADTITRKKKKEIGLLFWNELQAKRIYGQWNRESKSTWIEERQGVLQINRNY